MKTLFVFEGARREPAIFKTLESVFFKETERIECIYGTSILDLYKRMRSADFELDIVSVLKEKFKGRNDSPFSAEDKVSDFAQVFLFFDYDCQQIDVHDEKDLSDFNCKLGELLDFFNDETEHGKLYVNYPMSEAIRYTKKLPDEKFVQYTVPLDRCVDFKTIAHEFSDYGSLDFIVAHKRPMRDELQSIANNWRMLIEQNLSKACTITDTPKNAKGKTLVSQYIIFNAEMAKFIQPQSLVSILTAFPLFLNDYFSEESLMVKWRNGEKGQEECDYQIK